MKKFYSNFRRLLSLIMFITTVPSFAQFTLSTPVPSGINYFSNTAPGVIVFGVRNNNANSIVITDLSSYVENGHKGLYALWYHPTAVTGAPSDITTANGWVLASPPAMVNATTTAVVPILEGLNVIVPANTTYRLALQSPVHGPFYGVAASTGDIVSGDGVDIYLQGNTNSPTYTGGFPLTPSANTPRSFYGSISFSPYTACVNPPVISTAKVYPAADICPGVNTQLYLTGDHVAVGQTYVWQSSAALAGSYSDISTSSSTPYFSVNPLVTTYYRAAVTCGGSTTFSNPVAVNVSASFPGGTYTINNTQPTGSGNYNSFTDAINAINCGVASDVVFNVSANQTFTETLPEINGFGTASGTITFQKSGPGSNPKIVPLTGGTIASSTTLGADGDGIVVINGGDFITFDGIDLETSPSFTGNEMYEYGYYFKKASATDACKNVVIKNSTITLDKATILSFGIFVSNNSGSSAVTVTSIGGRSENIKLTGNTISNSYGGIQLRGFSSAAPYDFFDQNIEIGVDSGNTILDFGGGATATYGIYAIYQNGLKIAKNTIVSATGTTSTLYGIFTTTAVNSNLDIYGNTITVHGGGTTSSIYGINNGMGGTGTNNLVRIYNNLVIGSTFPTATSGGFYGIYQLATAFKAHLYGNIVDNNTFTPTTTGPFYGIYQGGAVVNESKVYDNRVTNNSKSTGTTGAMYCLYNSPSATANSEVYGNVIALNSRLGTSGILYGIAHDVGATTNIYKNNISGLVNTASTTGSTYGISVSGGTTNNVYNNFVSDLTAPTTNSTTDGVRGISVAYASVNTSTNLYYNTIYLNASSSGPNFSTSGIFHNGNATATTGAFTLVNNNVVNNSTSNGTGKIAAYRISTAALGNYNGNSNNNNFYAGSPSSNNVIFYDGTNFDEDLAAYKARVSPIDNSSISENPPFVNASSAPFDLHLDPSIPTQLEGGGKPVAGITDDFDSNPRNATTPDIGADEFAGTPTDLTAPNIIYTSLLGDCNTGNRTLPGVTISDASGVPITGSLVPRIYYRKGLSTWFSQPGTLTTGTGKNGTWSFPITASDMGGLVMGDTVYYYVIAQDVSPGRNIGSNAIGATAANVNTVSDHPSSPDLIYIGAALNGTYTVGSSGVFKTLTHAINVYNASTCLAGPVTLSLTDPDYSGNETFPIVINENSSASSTKTLTIISAPGNTASFSGTSGTSAAGLLKLNGADYVTIDGIAITVTGSATNEFGFGIQLVNDADNNTIQRCIINSTTSPATAASSAFAGIVINSTTSTTPIATGNSMCDNNTIAGNTIIGGYSGITVVANGATNTVSGNIIRNNIIQDFYLYGIYLNGTLGTQVDSNDISRPSRTSISTFNGVYLSTGNIGTKVSRNRMHDSFNGNTSATTASYGVYITASDATELDPNIISNNWVYNFNNSGTQYGFYNTSSDFAQYYYNSVLLDGPATASDIYDTRGFYQTTLATGLVYKNNIVHISRAAIGENHAFYMATATTTFTSDHNDFYVSSTSGTLNNVAFFNAIQYVTLADWQASPGSPDAHSVSVDPLFVSSSDLHLQGGSPLDDKGTPITLVTKDIDNELRDASTPDIGADEVPPSNGLDVKASLLVAPAVSNGCYNNENVVIRIKNNSVSPINFSTNPVTVNVNITGAATTTLSTTLTTGILAAGASQDVTMTSTLDMSVAGTYVFNASTSLTGDVNMGNNAMPEVTRVKQVLSAGTIASSQGSYCNIGGTPTLTASGLTGSSGIQWQQSVTPGSGFSNIPGAITTPFVITNPITQTMYYRLVVTCGTNTATSGDITVLLNKPQVTSTVPASICGSGTVDLQATSSPGTSLFWYTAATGGVPIGSGSPFTTPVITTNTTYYVSASTGGSSGIAGRTQPFPTSTGFAGNDYGLVFDVTQAFTLASVDIYSTAGGGSITIELTDASDVVLQTAGPFTIPAGGGTTFANGALPTTLPLNFDIVPGTGYRLRSSAHTGNIIRDNPIGSNFSYPLPIGSYGNITAGLLAGAVNANTYYYFYNWQFNAGCESPRTAVLARTDICTTYTFIGNGNWDAPANWAGGLVPPSTIPTGTEVILNPTDGPAVLNVPVTVQSGAIISVKPGKNFIVQGNLTFQQ